MNSFQNANTNQVSLIASYLRGTKKEALFPNIPTIATKIAPNNG